MDEEKKAAPEPWITGRDALKKYRQLEYGHALWEWVSHGLVRARATKVVQEGSEPKEDWNVTTAFAKAVLDPHFGSLEWAVGTFRGRMPDGMRPAKRSAFGVTFSEPDIRACLHLDADAAPIVSAAEETPNPRKSPVAPAKLRGWWDTFCKFADVDAFSEGEILASARQIFTDNHVSREAIRELRGPQKRGPKPIRGEVSAD